jgi:copper resistance protein C
VSRPRSLVAAGLSLCALLASTGVVSAHAQYQSSTPAANATVSAAPTAVQVTWSQEINAVQFTITGPDGSNVVTGAPQIDLEERHTASVPTRGAGPGKYLVVWHNVSDEDGDPNDGSFVFTVASPSSPATPTASPPPAQTSAPGTPTPSIPASPPAAGTPTPPGPGGAAAAAAGQVCVDNGVVTPGQADFRVNTYCKRQAIREQYKGKINELIFNYDLSIGIGLESSLKDAMGEGDSE